MTATQPTKTLDVRRRQRRLVWLFTVGVLLALMAAVAIRLSGDSDLISIAEEAKAQGVPLSWAEPGESLPESSRRVVVDRLEVLLDAGTAIGWKTRATIKLGAPLPREFTAAYAAPSEAMDEILSLVDQLGSGVLHDSPRHEGRYRPPYRQVVSRIARVLCNRLATIESSTLRHETERVVALIGTMPSDDNACFIEKASSLRMLTRTLTFRLADLKNGGGPAADAVVPAVESLAAFYRRCAVGQMIYEYSFLQDAWNRCIEEGQRLPAILDSSARLRFLCRIGRGGVLRKQLTWIRFLSSEPDLMAMWSEAKTYRIARGSTILIHPSDLLTVALMPDYKDLSPWSSEREITLRLCIDLLMDVRLLAAEAHGAAWPIDLFDPARGRLRPIERSGRVIGAYSVGEDGVDNGGLTSADRCWPLYEELGRPIASAPAPP